jgi:hypothetical protein
MMIYLLPSVEHFANPIAITYRIPNAVAHRKVGPKLFDFVGFSSNRKISFVGPLSVMIRVGYRVINPSYQ